MEKTSYGANPTNVVTPKKEFIKELFADMFSYYVRNVNSLNNDEKEDFQRMDKAANSSQLRNWAENIHVSGNAGDMTSIELANIIRSSDDKTLDELLLEIQQFPRFINEKATAIDNQTRNEKRILPDDTNVLYRNGEGTYTAIGEDAKKVASELGIMPDSSLGEHDAVNINRPGVALLKHNKIPYIIVNPATDLSMVYEKDNDITNENRLLMQMGHLAVLSKGDMVRFDTNGQIFEGEQTVQLQKGLFSASFISETDRMEILSFPIHQFNTQDGRSESYFSNMSDIEMYRLQTFFNDHYNELIQTVRDYPSVRRQLDDNLKTLIDQNDYLTKENPDTIILIKQHGFIEAFSDSAINAASTLGLALYNRTDHRNTLSIPFTRMTADDYEKLCETENNIYLSRPSAQERMTDAILTKVNPANMRPARQNDQTTKQDMRQTRFKR